MADLSGKLRNGTVAWNSSGIPSGIYVFKAVMGRHSFTKRAFLVR